MCVFPKQDKIINAIFKGIKNAKDNFSFWTSQELFLEESSENFFTVHICQEFAKLEESPKIFIDAKMMDVLKSSLHKKNSYKEFMKRNDIKNVAYSIALDQRNEKKNEENQVTKVIIDVNSNFTKINSYHIETLQNLCKMLQRDNKNDTSLDYAVFAFYLDISLKARKKIKTRLDEILEYFDLYISSQKNLKSHVKITDINKIENEGEWCIGCYVIEPDF